VPTEKPNGDADRPPEKRRKFHFYLFTPAKSIEHPRYASVAEALAGSHPNVGDLFLKVASKLVGFDDVASFAVQYLDDTNTVRLVVTPDGKDWVVLGTLAPE
jgi:hypothetical protein